MDTFPDVRQVETRFFVLEQRGALGREPWVTLRFKHPAVCSSGGWIEQAKFPDMSTALAYADELTPMVTEAFRLHRELQDARSAVTNFNYKHTLTRRIEGTGRTQYETVFKPSVLTAETEKQ